VALPGREISSLQGRCLCTKQQKYRINAHTDIHVLSEIRTSDSSVRASEYCGHCDRQIFYLEIKNVPRRIFGPKRDEVMRGWRKLHNEKLRNLYSSPNIIRTIKLRRMTLAGHVARMGKKRNLYRILVGKPERKRPLGTPRRRWVDSIKMDLREIGLDGMDWIDLAQYRDRRRALVNTAMNLRVP
jgi:hypothetical protein